MSSLKDKKLDAKIKRWNERKGYNDDFTFQDDFENALEDGDEKRVEKLMRRNPSAIANDDRTSALLFASRRGFDDAVRIILEENEEIIDDIGLNGYAAIHYAAKYGHEDILLMLIRRGADVNVIDDGGASRTLRRRHLLSLVQQSHKQTTHRRASNHGHSKIDFLSSVCETCQETASSSHLRSVREDSCH